MGKQSKSINLALIQTNGLIGVKSPLTISKIYEKALSGFCEFNTLPDYKTATIKIKTKKTATISVSLLTIRLYAVGGTEDTGLLIIVIHRLHSHTVPCPALQLRQNHQIIGTC